MAVMAEEVELTYGKAYRMLPEREIPLFYSGNVSTDQGKHGKENQDHARVDVSSEFT